LEVFLNTQFPELNIKKNEQKSPDYGEQGGDKNDPLLEACREFESIFIFYMFKAMRGTVPEGGLIPRGMGEEIFESMLDEEVARKASQNEDYGLARLLHEQLNRINIKPGE